MKQNSGRLILKVKKKRNSLPQDVTKQEKKVENNKENVNQCIIGRKRSNPFLTSVLCSKKINIRNNDFENDSVSSQNRTNKLLKELEQSECKNKNKNSSLKINNEILENLQDDKNLTTNNETNNVDKDTDQNIIYSTDYPLDWTLKEKIKFTSSQVFSEVSNIKSINEAEGIRNFAASTHEREKLCQHLYNWVYPNIPGVQQFPLKKKATGVVLKEEKIPNVFANNKPFHDVVMTEWRKNFQSLFTILKNGYCPYFYLCSYQMTVLFKSAIINGDGIVAIVTPTTKGLRKMLSDEGLSFTLPYLKSEERQSISNEDKNMQEECDEETTTEELNTSNEDDFLNSIGLDKKHYFPHMQEQERLQEKAKTRLLDNRMESTIIIKNCVGFFNFLLNSTFLCAPSGTIMGVPPTLISPSPFEGGSLQRNKLIHGPVKVQVNGYTKTNYNLEVSGIVLPTQVEGLIRLIKLSEHQPVSIKTKSYEQIVGLNTSASGSKFITDELCQSLGTSETTILCLQRAGLSSLPLHDEVKFENGTFVYQI